MHRRLRRVVIALRLRPVDDEAGHRPDIDDAPPPRLQHVPPDSARTPEAAVEVHREHLPPMLVGDLPRPGFAARGPCIVDQDVDTPIARPATSRCRAYSKPSHQRGGGKKRGTTSE